ncbi:MAG TPA: helicase-associated domain-containing protein, partial [Spirochaetota bacterium]
MSKPAIVQSDNTILLEVENGEFEEARDAISPFAELEKSPEHVHTYRITPLSLWNAASSGLCMTDIITVLQKYSRYAVPESVSVSVNEQMSRYGLIRLIRRDDGRFCLVSNDVPLLTEIVHNRKIDLYIEEHLTSGSVLIKPNSRGHVKQALIKAGFPVEDVAGYDEGEHLEVALRETSVSNHPFALRDYQESAVNAFHKGGGPEGGSGVIVLPCGAGKTIVGIGVLGVIKTATLILVTNTVALRQWRDELIDKTDIDPDLIGEFSGEKKEIKPITIATYNILTYRKKRDADFEHFSLFSSRNWGLIIYDEVHL